MTSARSVLAVLGLVACGDDYRIEFDVARVWGGNLAVAGGRVYTTTFGEACGGTVESGHAVWSFPVDGGEPVQITCGGPHELFGYGLAIANGRIYWTAHGTSGPPQIFAAPLEGGERELIGSFHTERAAYANVVATGDFLYAGAFGEVVRVPLSGGATTTVFDPAPQEVAWFDVDGDSLLVTTWGGVGRAIRADLDGTRPSTLDDAIAGASPTQFGVAADAIYVPRDQDILRVPRDGSPHTSIPLTAAPRGCVVHDGALLTSYVGQIVRVGFDGTLHVVAAIEPKQIFHLVVADGVLHYVGIGLYGRVAL